MDDTLSLACGPRVGDSSVSHLQLWQDVVEKRPDAIAVISHHQSPSKFPWAASQFTDSKYLQWTFTELDRGARQLATALNRLIHVERRPLAALVNNQAEWALLYWAAAYLHSPFVPINPKSATRVAELNHIMHHVQPAVVVAADSLVAQQLENSLPRKVFDDIPLRLVLSNPSDHTLADSWIPFSSVMLQNQSPPDTPDHMAGSDTSLILFTSGTTSLPKPCALTSFQCLNAALGYMDAQEVGPGHRYVQHLPGFHSYGIGWTLGVWLRGATLIFPSENFEAQASLQCFTDLHATHMCLVPTTAQAMTSHSALASADLSSLISIDISGAGVHPSLIETCTQAFKVPCCSSYGMTESPGTLAWPANAGPVIREGNVMSGRPQRNTLVKICEPGTRDILPRGHTGELHNGGDQVISRYMDPEASTAEFYQDDDGVRWIISGDQAVMTSDGTVYITGRYKDMIIRGGENISPASIEDYLCKRSDIVAAYVVGQQDEMAGEVPVAVITTASGCDVDVNEVKQAAASDLGPAFAPKMILHLENQLGLKAFPMTASGKVRKVELKDVVSKYLEEQSRVNVNESGLTVDALVAIWQSISGTMQLTPATVIDAFADSLMMMQLSGTVKKDLGRDITVEDFKLCPTIQDQADLIDSRPMKKKAAKPQLSKGPPALQDVAHANGSGLIYDETRMAVTEILAPMDLSWDDVEDVVPLHDWAAIFCHRSRPSSWSIRFGYQAPVDVETLTTAVKSALAYHPTLRSLALPTKHGEALLVTVRSCERWIDASITTGWEVETAAELETLLADRPDLQIVTAPGPLMKFHLVKIRQDNSSGLITVGCHAVHDMSMTKLWLDDILTLLTTTDSPLPHGSFKEWASAYYTHRNSAEASAGVHHWAHKYQGISQLPETAFWPPQRAPEWFKGDDIGWCRWNNSPARRGERTLPLADKLAAQKGIARRIPIRDIQDLKSSHNIPVFMLVKAAVALLNAAKTGSKEAVFGTINAARKWPFPAAYTSLERESHADTNPLDISGCTTQYVLDRIPVSPRKDVLAFMQLVEHDESANNAYVHAPFHRIVDALRDPLHADDSRTFLERDRDAEAILPLIRRQSFNWLPTGRAVQDPRGLVFNHHLTRMDNGLTITGFLDDDKRSVVVSFTWDAEHLSVREANSAIDLLARLVEKLGSSDYWGWSVGELVRMCM